MSKTKNEQIEKIFNYNKIYNHELIFQILGLN